MNVIHQNLILIFKYIILEKIVCNDKLSKNKLVIYKKLKKLIIIFIFVVRLHFFNFDIKLNFNFKIKLCKDINNFILDEYSFDSHIADKIIYKDDKIIALIFWDKKQITYVKINKIKKLFWLNSLFSEYLFFHLLFLNTKLTNWFWFLFWFLFSFFCEFMKFDFQSYLLNIFDIINIKMI